MFVWARWALNSWIVFRAGSGLDGCIFIHFGSQFMRMVRPFKVKCLLGMIPPTLNCVNSRFGDVW